MRTFFPQIQSFTMSKLVKNANFLVKNKLLSANSVFEVLNEGKYLPQIMRETGIPGNLYITNSLIHRYFYG